MSTEILARVQFALTIMFHYIYVPLSIGIGILLVVMEGIYLKTRNPVYERMTRFWVRVFALTFSMGVATGIVMEFQFGTNWSVYSRYVGDVFGSALAAEGIFAFFLESGFLALLVFGWNRVGPKMHFFSTIMVCLGSTFSAVWIVIANSWMHTPAGHKIITTATGAQKAVVDDFWAMIFNPSSVERLTHTLGGCWSAGAFLVLSVSAYYVVKKKHLDVARPALKIALTAALLTSLFMLYTGHANATMISKHQPAKLAAFEGHYKTEPADLYLFGWVDDKEEKVRFGIRVPRMLSFLVHGDISKPVKGLNEFKREDRPRVNVVFQLYHLMVAIGFTLIGLSVLGTYYWWRGTLFEKTWLLKLFVPAVILPMIANHVGWAATEIGRQPWVVYGLLRTKDALSPNVKAGEIWFSLILFTTIYLLLFALFIFLLNSKIQHGPEPADEEERSPAKFPLEPGASDSTPAK